MASTKISPDYETRTQTLLSAESVANNESLLTEILLRVPIKSLLTFKSVSKHWLFLISSPHFCHLRSPLQGLPSGLFLSCNPPSDRNKANPEFDFVNLDQVSHRPPFRTLSFVNDPCGITILQSCNGLLLCCSARLDPPLKNYYVYNPTTAHYTILPPLPVRNEEASTRRTEFSLAFDPAKSPHFKVVCVISDYSSYRVEMAEIYSSETGSWRLCAGSLPSNLERYNVEFDGGVFWNGCVHWVSRGDCVSTWGTAFGVYFNVEEERMRDMPLPPVPDDFEWDDSLFLYFGESGDHLHLVGYGGSGPDLIVYEMERDYSSWSVKFHIDLDEASVAYPQMVDDSDFLEFSVICVIRCEPEEESYMVVHINGALLVYYLTTKTFKKLCDCDYEVDMYGFGIGVAYQFIESLAYV